MSFDPENGGIVALNVLPKKLNSITLKIWQRYAAASAAIEVIERQREGNIDIEDYILLAYKRHVDIILEKHTHEIPSGLTKNLMMKDSYTKEVELTGKQIWNTIWLSMNTHVCNVILIMWLKVRPTTKSGQILSGVQNFEPALLELRKLLFDLSKNSIHVMSEDSPNKPQSSTGQDDKNNSNHVTMEDDPNNPQVSTDQDEINAAESRTTDVSIGETLVNNNNNNPTVPLNEKDDSEKTSDAKNKSKRGRKKQEPCKKIPFDPNWFPMEWLAFREFGPLSENPFSLWRNLSTPTSKKSVLLSEGNEEHDYEDEPRKDLGRRSQRKKKRAEKRDDPRNKDNLNNRLIEVDDSEDDLDIQAVLSGLSSVKDELATSEKTMAAERQKSNKLEETKLKMDLLDRMTMTSEEKAQKYKELFESLS